MLYTTNKYKREKYKTKKGNNNNNIAWRNSDSSAEKFKKERKRLYLGLW